MGVFLDLTEEIVQRPDGFIAFCVGASTYWHQNQYVSAVHRDFNLIAKRLCDKKQCGSFFNLILEGKSGH